MLRKVINYTDFNGEKQQEVLYFNLNKAELGKLQMRMDGKFLDHLRTLLEKRRIESLYDFFYDLVLNSYGEKDASGKRFNKSPAIRADFENSIAFPEVLMDIISSTDNMSGFIKGILPPDMMSEVGDLNVEALPAEAGNVEPRN